MEKLKFCKFEATGNDFIVITAEGERDWCSLSQAMCHRKLGVGADGLILILPSQVAHFRIRLFNPDGSEAEISGNGLRCCTKYAVERNLAPGQELKVETQAGVKEVTPMLEKGKVIQVNVNMGRPKFLFDIKPLFGYPLEIEGGRLLLNLISMGNPHCVCFLEQPVDDFPLTYLGPKVENHPLFPKRTNFEIANILGRREIRARVWERGAGETLSCGSGACAIGAVAYLQGYVDNDVDISFPGGTLKVSWGKGGDIYLTGPVTEVFNGEWG